jgi:hypothetical protein
MANNYYDATGVLVLGQVTPVITALFGGMKLDPSFPGNGEVYIAHIGEESGAHWDDVRDNLIAVAQSLGLSVPGEDACAMDDVLDVLSRHFGTDQDEELQHLIEHHRFEDAYIRPSGDRKGEAAASLKGRLLKAELVDRAELAKIEQHELITRGIGYLNRPQEVTPKNGDPFLSCSIAALAGPVDEPEYRYIDTIVATEDAQHLVRRCVQAVEAERKVLIAFRLNDMRIDPYIRTKGERAGEAAASLESTLVHIGLIKIDGQKVYPEAEADAEAPEAQDAAAPEADGKAEVVTATQPAEPAEREPEVEVEEREPALAASF